MGSVIHISEAANLAIHTMILLASQPKKPLRVNRAVEVLKVSGNHLAKVLQRLAHAGLVTSTRGPRGGFSLAKDARHITLLEVFEAIEGPLKASPCLLGKPRCVGTCILGMFAMKATGELKRLLAGAHLSDLAGKIERSDAA